VQKLQELVDLENLATIYPGLVSSPPVGKYPVTNLFVDPGTGRLTVEYNDVYTTHTGIDSSPPVGKCRVTNLFIEPGTEKLTVEYDDVPES
jgi:hypothetical protein